MAFIEIGFNAKRPLILGRGVHVAPGGIVKASAEVADFGKVDSGEIVRSPWENQ